MATNTLTVIPNPFAVPLDHEDLPCAQVRPDPASPIAAKFIGAVPLITPKGQAPKANDPGAKERARFRVRFSYDFTPVVLANTSYHRESIVGGSLLPADQQTAVACRVKFVEPRKALLAERDKAIAALRAEGREPPLMQWAELGIPVDDLLPAAPATDTTGRSDAPKPENTAPAEAPRRTE